MKIWELKDPNDDTVRDTLKARKLWEQILETRFRTLNHMLTLLILQTNICLKQ